jgi:peroxiredoxin
VKSIGNRKSRLTLEYVAWALLLGFIAYRMAPQVKAAFGAGGADSPAPAFELATLDGAPVSLADLRGKVVVVNFWATWCPPCRVEMPGFQRVYADRRDEGLVIVGISMDQGGEGVVREFLRERGITFPVALADGDVAQAFGGVRTLPTSFLIDREGRIRQEVTGLFAEPTLRMAVGHLLDEPAPSPRPAGGER